MEQRFENYTQEDHQIWKILFDRQMINLENRVCSRYLETVEELSSVFNDRAIPQFTDLDKKLLSKTGWSIEVVPGLIPVEDFFDFLKERRFCSSRWLRARHQLDYIEEPDMFHDTFGHIPLLMDTHYAAFTRKIGELGSRFKTNKTIVKQLQRIYWFTNEFGILKEEKGYRIYGAGIISSPKESESVFKKEVKKIPFDLDKIINHEFRTDILQDCYYFIESFEQLYKSIKEYELKITSQISERQRSF